MKNQKNVKLTPKQANIAAASILRGLDNSINDAKKNVAKLEDFKAKVSNLSAGLSNLASAPPAKPAKPAAPAKPAKPAKAAAKPAPKAKPAAPAKPAKPAKPVKAAKPVPAKPKPAPAKPAPKSDEQKPPVQGRPSIRQAVKDLLRTLPAGTTIHTTEAYAKIVSKYGYWSKQTFYGLVNNDPEISNADSQLSMASGKEAKAAPKAAKPAAPKAAKPARAPKAETKPAPSAEAPKDDRVDNLVRKVEQDKSTSAVV